MYHHVPVLLEEVAAHIGTARRIVDATVGGGGHTRRLIDLAEEMLVVDRDPEAIAATRERLADRPVRYVQGGFADPEVVAEITAFRPEAILIDLGVSSHQIDDDGRGFTFRPGAPLDMRMDPSRRTTAAAVLNGASLEELASWFRDYADEPRARRLARAIDERRRRARLMTSDDLVAAIRRGLGPRSGPSDFARLFQAVRIVVNDELGQLERALPAFRDALVPGGRLLVITYHSGEDRIVKHAFRDWAKTCICPPRQPICTCRGKALGRVITRKGLSADPAEVAENPRARSATLRVFERTV